MFEREEEKIVVRGTAAQQEGECAVNKTAEAFKGPHHLAHRPASATVRFGICAKTAYMPYADW